MDDINQRNQALLAAYAHCRSIRNRNAVVHANLPLVWRLARLESQRTGHSYDDLTQVGCLGLIQAVEQFELGRGTTLSTAATPWIRGAIRHYLRDRVLPIRASHHLLELERRGRSLQQQRQHQQQPPLAAEALAQQLGCSIERWQQALELRHSLQVACLDQASREENGDSGTLLDQLADPRSGDRYAAAIRHEQRCLLWRGLRQLDSSQRRLVLGRVLQQRSWRELGERLGWSGKVAQRQCERLLEQLRRQLEPQWTAALEGARPGS